MVSSREFQAQPSPPLQRCPKLGRSLPHSSRTGVGLGLGEGPWGQPRGGQQMWYGLFFLCGLGQILPLLWVSVSSCVQWNQSSLSPGSPLIRPRSG